VSERILVIKLGALGDFVLATGPMAAIRRHHPAARITLLTTRALAELAEASPHVDEVWYDERPRWSSPRDVLALRRRLREGRFTRVYDLQTSDRSSFYFLLLLPGPRPEWSGIARGASHPQRDPARERMHTIERQKDQLRMAGIDTVPPPDVSWAARPVEHFDMPARYVLLIPGGSAHRPEKRWPIERYAELARRLVTLGLAPVIIGGAQEEGLGKSLAAAAPGTRDLTGRTSFGEIVGLARGAWRTIGNDTGPLHLAVAAGSPATVLFSRASDPGLTAPRGKNVAVLRRDALGDLSVEEVLSTA
jgi:ADP-heptose:LPS heptosyltransferase